MKLIFHMLLLIVVRFYFLQKNIALVDWDQFGFIWKPPHTEIDASSQIVICQHTSLWHTSCCWPRTDISCFWNFWVRVLILIAASSGNTKHPCYAIIFSRFQSWIKVSQECQGESQKSGTKSKIRIVKYGVVKGCRKPIAADREREVIRQWAKSTDSRCGDDKITRIFCSICRIWIKCKKVMDKPLIL